MKRPPHPCLRRLFAAGAAPIEASRRLTRTGEMLASLLRGIDELRFPLVEAIEPLLREIDLAGIGRRATAAIERRRTRVAVPPRRNIRRSGAGSDVGTAETKRKLPGTAGSPVSSVQAGEVAAILRRYEHNVIESRGEGLAGTKHKGEDTATDIAARAPERQGEPATPFAAGARGGTRYDQPGERSHARTSRALLASGPAQRPKQPAAEASPHASGGTGSTARAGRTGPAGPAARTRLISQSDAIESLRRRAARVGDAIVLDAAIAGTHPDSEIAELLERVASTADAPRPAAGAAHHGWDGMARLVRTLDDFRRASPLRSGAFGGSAIGQRAVPSHGADREKAPYESTFPAADGLRGLAARVSRSVPEDFAVRRPPPARPSNEDFAERLDALLRNEALRQGIDLEGIER